ncbi:hypothetical protein [Chryseobacterium sp.]|uniref:hypothetical protein n=1 Tax=Chryseobacterium sp. TaxID=1871047 RepID=UPI0025BC4F56|nr:hypothetical protein [Chryseobacterium sp.]
MIRLFVLCLVILTSCTNMTTVKSQNIQNEDDIFISESQGGTGTPEFTIIQNEQDFRKAINKNQFQLIETGNESTVAKGPGFPKNKKVVLYNLGTFRSGDHRISEIKNMAVKNNVLIVEVPYYESGGMEIQMISNPWMIFTVPLDYQFNSVELKYSK